MEFIELYKSDMKGTKPDIKLNPGCWIAGGAIRRWYSGEEQTGDIDIFFKDEESITRFVDENGLKTCPSLVNDNRMIMYKDKPYQLIRNFRGKDSFEKTIMEFDFTICQFAYDYTGKITTTAAALRDVKHKRLDLNYDGLQLGEEVNLMRRAFKYAKSGYWPDMEVMHQIAQIINRATEEAIDNAILPQSDMEIE